VWATLPIMAAEAAHHAGARRGTSYARATLSLLWRIFLGNAAVLGIAVAVLVLTPVTVSFPAAGGELLVLAAGLVVMLAVNYVLLRRAVGPLVRLTSLMEAIDPLRPGRRADLPAQPREVAALGAAFDRMLGRLETERRDSARRALAAQEDERLRIARELHDEVGQALTAVLLQLEQAKAGTDTLARIDEARAAPRATLEEVRGIARNLRPEALDDLGLTAAIRQLCNETERTGILVTREIDADVQLNRELEVVVYRIAQEAITNALRHAEAERLAVTLHHNGDLTELVITDDGRGQESAREGSGLRGMRERAVLAGAFLSITTLPEGGTRVRLRIS
jgi:two-component system sensor histidine kinase UhpB